MYLFLLKFTMLHNTIYTLPVMYCHVQDPQTSTSTYGIIIFRSLLTFSIREVEYVIINKDYYDFLIKQFSTLSTIIQTVTGFSLLRSSSDWCTGQDQSEDGRYRLKIWVTMARVLQESMVFGRLIMSSTGIPHFSTSSAGSSYIFYTLYIPIYSFAFYALRPIFLAIVF